MPNIALMVASSDEHFREMVRDSLLNIPQAKIAAEYLDVAPNLWVACARPHRRKGLISAFHSSFEAFFRRLTTELMQTSRS